MEFIPSSYAKQPRRIEQSREFNQGLIDDHTQVIRGIYFQQHVSNVDNTASIHECILLIRLG
jgi:hypothetical protein